jgi:7-cyano-7-deazaguanine synthase in queuosine biosynthesis
MPKHEHLVLCGGLDRPSGEGTRPVQLSLHGPSRNVRLRIEDISAPLVANVPDVLVDLLDVAAYVYATDSAVPRGGPTDEQMGARWRRRLRLVVPVRDPDLWAQDAISSALVETLSFLSDDEYQFEFEPVRERPTMNAYFSFGSEAGIGFAPHEVILFSGGLDSLAGTVEELVAQNKSVALVSHRSSTKIVEAQMHLVRRLRQSLGANRVFHVPVWANLVAGSSRESTHRTRSFLFAALGAVTASLFGVNRITFFENGIVSLNLPPLAQVVGARATRATHPQVLAGFRRLLSQAVGQSFDVASPFRWLTKAEVVERVSVNGFKDLIRDTRSCAHVHEMTRLHPHCGQCSQCIDRRFAVLAAGLEQEDPSEAYKVDLFASERLPGPGRELALAYVRSASDIKAMSEVAFFSRYGEASRAVGFFAEPPGTVAKRIFDLHRRHANAVCAVFDGAILTYAAGLREGTLPSSCLLTLVVGQRYGGSAYPAQTPAIEQPIPARPEIRMAIEEARKRVVFKRWGEIAGVSAELLIALAERFRKATKDELAPENYPFVKTADLLRGLRCKEETLRRRVLRCRSQIAHLAMAAGEPAPATDAVIENIQWRGYRLNPDSIRIVAITELRQAK